MKEKHRVSIVMIRPEKINGHPLNPYAIKTGLTLTMDIYNSCKGGDFLGSVIKKRRKKMRKHKHRKLLARTRHQRRKGK